MCYKLTMQNNPYRTHGKTTAPADIRNGAPANGLVWGLENFGSHRPPEDGDFYSRDGRQFLRCSSWEQKMRRQKARPKPWYTTAYDGLEYTETEEGEYDVFTWKTPAGTVTGRRHENHFCEYPVKSIGDLDTWINVYSHMSFQPNASWLAQRDVRDVGIVCLSPSPVQQLLEYDIGVENFYYFLMDAPDKMHALLETMQARCMDKLRLGLGLFPHAGDIYCAENTSSSLISPSFYRQLTLPHIQAYARLAHQHNKRLNVHMCGLLQDLLDCFLLTEMDGIDSVTPPPIGNTPFRLVREKFKPDFYILGRMSAQLWMGKDREGIKAVLRELIYPELLQTPFILCVASDAIPDIPREDAMNLYEALETMDW